MSVSVPEPQQQQIQLTEQFNITFDKPCRRVIEQAGKIYFFQEVKNHNADVMIVSEWFRGDGAKPGFDKKPEMFVKVDGHMRAVLDVFESEAVKQLKVTDDVLRQMGIAQQSANVDSKAVYKPVFRGEYMYVKLHRDCAAFNARKEVMRTCNLGYGEYRVVLNVTGLYIGLNSDLDLTASLHIRVYQIQFRDVNVTCLFDSLPTVDTTAGDMASTSITRTLPTAPQQTKRGGGDKKKSKERAKPDGEAQTMEH